MSVFDKRGITDVEMSNVSKFGDEVWFGEAWLPAAGYFYSLCALYIFRELFKQSPRRCIEAKENILAWDSHLKKKKKASLFPPRVSTGIQLKLSGPTAGNMQNIRAVPPLFLQALLALLQGWSRCALTIWKRSSGFKNGLCRGEGIFWTEKQRYFLRFFFSQRLRLQTVAGCLPGYSSQNTSSLNHSSCCFHPAVNQVASQEFGHIPKTYRAESNYRNSIKI